MIPVLLRETRFAFACVDPARNHETCDRRLFFEKEKNIANPIDSPARLLLIVRLYGIDVTHR